MKAIDLAHYVINKCTEDKKFINNIQLQRILYFIQLTYCRATNGKLLFSESFEAWPYGPIVVSVYQEYIDLGARFINKKYTINIDNKLASFLNSGIEILREKYPWDLIRSSNAPGSPWDKIYQNGSGYKKIIPNKLIICAALAKKENV